MNLPDSAGAARTVLCASARPASAQVALTRKSKYLEWNTDELRDVMKDDKSVEAAVLNTCGPHYPHTPPRPLVLSGSALAGAVTRRPLCIP